MENPDEQRLESDFERSHNSRFSPYGHLPNIEAISKEIDAGTRYYFDENSRCVSFLSYRAHVYQCPGCNATILIEFVSRDGSSTSDRGAVACPNCERNTVALYSAGWESSKILESKKEGEEIIKQYENS